MPRIQDRRTDRCGRWILLLVLFTFIITERCAAREMKIVIGTDLHYISSQLEDGGERFMRLLYDADGKVCQYSEEIVDAFLQEVIREKPDVLLLTGDLTFNGEKVSHEDLAEKLEKVRQAGIRVITFPGNHDLANKMARRFSGETLFFTPTIHADEFEKLYASFGPDQALYRDGYSLSFVVPLSETLWLLCVDVNAEDSPGVLKEETLSWIRPILEEAAGRGVTILSASHQNLLVHNKKFNMGFTMGNAGSLLELYRRYGVRLNLSGHMHIQHILTEESVTDIATSCMMTAPCQYGILTIAEDGACEYNTRAVDVRAWAQEKGLENEELLNFPSFARIFFDTMARRSAAKALGGLNLDEELQTRLTNGMTALNRAYFAGRMDLMTNGKEIYEDWKKNCPDPFLLFYMKSIVQNETEDQNHWKGELK